MLTAPPAVLLEQHRPVLVYDARERDHATSVARWRDPRAPHADVVYGRAVRDEGRTWLQYWLFYRDNTQDRGVLRSGRHAGDWEFAQLGLDAAGRPRLLTLSQHSWSETCRVARMPALYVAHGSHATYRTRGEHGRPWPDPDDEARGDGRRVRPRLIVMRDQSWLRYRGHWGGARAAWWMPAEQSSPRGPAFQDDDRWTAPAAYARAARACGSGAPGHPPVVWAVAAVAAAALLAAAVRVLRR